MILGMNHSFPESLLSNFALQVSAIAGSVIVLPYILAKTTASILSCINCDGKIVIQQSIEDH